MGAVGLLAGVAATAARMPLHLPGHKAVLWMTPLLTARLLTRARWGALVGALAAVAATTLAGGRLAGGAAGVPFVLAAAAMIDVAVDRLATPDRPTPSAALALAAVASMGNLLCFVGRALDPSSPSTMFSAGPDPVLAAASHAAFGAMAGLIGAPIGLVVRPRNKAKK